MKLLDKRADQQYCIDEAAAEVALCRVLGIPYCVDEHYVAHIQVGAEAVGLVVIPGDETSIELDFEHLRELAVDIIVFAHVRVPEVNLVGWLTMDSIRKLWAGRPNSRTALAIDPKSLESFEELAMKVRRESR
jgi:hypothetical protein